MHSTCVASGACLLQCLWSRRCVFGLCPVQEPSPTRERLLHRPSPPRAPLSCRAQARGAAPHCPRLRRPQPPREQMPTAHICPRPRTLYAPPLAPWMSSVLTRTLRSLSCVLCSAAASRQLTANKVSTAKSPNLHHPWQACVPSPRSYISLLLLRVRSSVRRPPEERSCCLGVRRVAELPAPGSQPRAGSHPARLRRRRPRAV